jgi:AcrR family transcriptional regulator
MPSVRHRTPSIEIENAVVEAALRLLAEVGPAALTVRGLAAEAGIAPMSIYNHFGDKNGVIDILFRRGFEELTRSVSIGLDSDDPIEGLRAGLLAYRRFALEHRTTYAVMFLREVPNFTPTADSLVIAAESFAVLIRAVERAIHAGDMRHGHPPEIAQQLWAATHGAVALELVDMCLVDDVTDMYDSLINTLLTGLRATPSLSVASRSARKK